MTISTQETVCLLTRSLEECLAIIRVQNGNLHPDINEIMERAVVAIEAAHKITNITTKDT